MPISDDSKIILRGKIAEINAKLVEVSTRLDAAQIKKDSAVGLVQQIQAEKNELQRQKQAILGDIP